jgi:hypothetical protein
MAGKKSEPKLLGVSDVTGLAASLDAMTRRAREGRPADLNRLRELAGAFLVELYPDALTAAVVVELRGGEHATIPLLLPASGLAATG